MNIIKDIQLYTLVNFMVLELYLNQVILKTKKILSDWWERDWNTG